MSSYDAFAALAFDDYQIYTFYLRPQNGSITDKFPKKSRYNYYNNGNNCIRNNGTTRGYIKARKLRDL